MKKSLIYLLGLCFAVVMMLSACSSGESSSGDSHSPQEVTLNLSLWDENVSDVVDESIELMQEENPHIKVEVTYSPFDDYWTRLQTSLAGGSGPDVFWMNGPNFHQYRSSGLIHSIEDRLESDGINKENYTDALVDLYSYEGELYGLPYFLDSIGLFYNKALFDEAGIDYPDESWTWDTVREVGEQLTNPEESVYGYVASTSNQEGYYNYIHQAGGFIISDDLTESGFNTPEAMEAFRWMQELMDAGISPSHQSQVETDNHQLFGSGRTAMLPLLSVRSPEMYELLGDDLGVAPLPQGNEQASIVHGLSWVMNSDTEHEEEAWELIKALAGEEAGYLMAKSGFSIPAYEGTEEAWLESIPSLDLQVFIDSLDFGVPYPVSKNTTEWQEVEESQINNVFLGRTSLEEALSTLEEEMNSILEQEQSE